MIVWISGPTGAGKTSVSHQLRRFGYKIIDEDISTETFRKFVANPGEYCALLQEEIMKSRHQGWLRASAALDIAFDRSVAEDAAIFCRLHFENDLIKAADYDKLKRLSEELQCVMPRPDVILFLSASFEVLHGRIVSKNHPATIISTLRRQLSLYHDWITYQVGDVVRIDNSCLSKRTMERFFRR
jgi:deoxyadenosine/deoxycytidine kinase